jgi:hypothetical protein
MTASLLKASSGEVKISWRLRGNLILNLVIALCIAPANHRALDLKERTHWALAGFLLVDLFSILAQVTCRKLNWGKGTTWLAPQTAHNLQQVCLGIVSVALTKSRFGDPWSGTNRLNEISIEEHFGRIRMSSANAQVTARSYWKAVARESLLRRDKVQVQNPLVEIPPLTDEEFEKVCDKAYASALAFVCKCSDASVEKLEHMYKNACNGKELEISSLRALEPNPVEADEEDMMHISGHDPAQGFAPDEPEKILKTVQQDAASLEYGGEAEENNAADEPPEEVDDLGGIADLAEIRAAATADDDPSTVPQVPLTKLPTTLSEALEAVENGRPFWDTIWRLTLFLRHGWLRYA